MIAPKEESYCIPFMYGRIRNRVAACTINVLLAIAASCEFSRFKILVIPFAHRYDILMLALLKCNNSMDIY